MQNEITLQAFIQASKDRHEREHAQNVVAIEQVWAAVEGLIREGFPVEHEPWHASHRTIQVDLADLVRVYRAVGSVEVWYKDVAYDKVTHEPLTDCIQVVLQAKKFPCVHFRYIKPLPPMDHSPKNKKCRIVTTSRVETSTQLVCDRD